MQCHGILFEVSIQYHWSFFTVLNRMHESKNRPQEEIEKYFIFITLEFSARVLETDWHDIAKLFTIYKGLIPFAGTKRLVFHNVT